MRTITGPTDPAHGVDLETPASLTPQRPPPDPRPSLCEAGPCRHYHRFAIQVDAEPPKVRRLPVVVPGVGDTYEAPAGFHAETHRYCYPDTGIEMPLGVMPVTECNRWEPVAPDAAKQKRETAFWGSAAGRSHRYAEHAWRDRQFALAREADEAEQLILEAQVDAELALCTFSASQARRDDYDGPAMYRATCVEFPQYSRDAPTDEAARALVYEHVRGRIRHMILNNDPLPSTTKGDR